MRTAHVLIAFLLLCTAGLAQTDSDSDDSGGYTGPAVLSRAGRPIGRYLGQPLSFRFFASTTGHYWTDLTPASSEDEDGDLYRADSYGGMVNAGVYGVRHGPHDSLGVDVHGSYRVYEGSQRKRSDSGDARIGINYARQVSARTAFELSASAGTFSGYSSTHSIVTTDPYPNDTDPTAEVFTNRAVHLGASAGVSYNATKRWFVTFTGGGSYIDRRTDALLDSRGMGGGSQLGYRVNGRTSIGLGYNFSHFEISHDIAKTNSHRLSFVLNHQIARRWSANLSVGAFRADSERLQAVELDPVLASLLGPQRILEPISRISWGPAISASLNHSFRRSSAGIYYNHGISQGNAYIAISETDNLGAHYSYTATSRLNVGLSARYMRHKGVTQEGATYENVGGGIGMNYRLTSFLHFTSGFNYYRGSNGGNGFSRDSANIFAGLSFSPGELPLSLF